MKIPLASLAMAVLVTTAAVSAPAATAVFKCMPRPALPSVVRAPELGTTSTQSAANDFPDPVYQPAPTVYVIDGKIASKAAYESTDPKSIEAIDVVCADERHRIFGVEPWTTLVVMFTRPGPYSALQTSLESIVPKQAAYLARHGRFATSLEELRWRDRTGLISVQMTVSEDGNRWSASGTHGYLIDAEPLLISGSRALASGKP